MKCHQCERPALFNVGNTHPVHLCLHCYSVWRKTQDIAFLQNAIMLNHALDSMDMVTGIPSTEGRLPVHLLANAMAKGHTLNNIYINQSQIGILNTGAIEKIDATITLTKNSDAESIGETIKDFVNSVIRSKDIDDKTKNDILDLTETVAEEIIGKRKRVTIDAVMKSITEKLDGVSGLTAAAAKLWDVIGSIIS